MKIVITGASGHIGQALVPFLSQQGHKLLLTGRNAAALATLFPGHQCCNYHDLAQAAEGYDICVHLAVKNNTDDKGDLESFRAANVAALRHIFGVMQSAGIKQFINLASFHSANPAQMDPYAVSKREGEAWLMEQGGAATNLRITSLRLPAVYSAHAQGNLAIINKLPQFLRPAAAMFLGALKPVVNIERVVAAIADNFDHPESGADHHLWFEEFWIANPQDENLFFAAFKKLIDWGFALTVIGLLWWLMAVIYIAVKTSSPGPGIFRQIRIGRHGKSFTCYKFRTMREGTIQAGTHDVSQAAITGIGRFLRKSKIDELPQVANILRGELSLVGPRPCLPVQTQLIAERAKRGVLTVVPGITGWAQINDIDMSDPERLAKADGEYMARRNIPFELSIIIKTFIGAGQGDRTGTG